MDLDNVLINLKYHISKIKKKNVSKMYHIISYYVYDDHILNVMILEGH
jgi:hypothetical protein